MPEIIVIVLATGFEEANGESKFTRTINRKAIIEWVAEKPPARQVSKAICTHCINEEKRYAQQKAVRH